VPLLLKYAGLKVQKDVFMVYIYIYVYIYLRLAMGWTVRGSNPGGGEIFSTRPDLPWGLPSFLYKRIPSLIPGGKAAGVALTTHPHLVPRLKKE
jgi:hypothetical protein